MYQTTLNLARLATIHKHTIHLLTQCHRFLGLFSLFLFEHFVHLYNTFSFHSFFFFMVITECIVCGVCHRVLHSKYINTINSFFFWLLIISFPLYSYIRFPFFVIFFYHLFFVRFFPYLWWLGHMYF